MKKLMVMLMVVGVLGWLVSAGYATTGVWLNWQVDDGSAGSYWTDGQSALDSSGSGRNGVYHNPDNPPEGYWSSDTRTGSGVSIYINPTDSGHEYVSYHSDSDSWNMTDWDTEDRVYEVDFKVESGAPSWWTSQYVFDERVVSGTSYGGALIRVERQSDTTYRIVFGVRSTWGSNYWYAQQDSAITTGQWYHAKLVIDDPSDWTKYHAYLNETEIAGVRGSGPPGAQTGTFDIAMGAMNNGGNCLHGYVDNLVIANVPEPATIGLVSFGAIGFIRRKK